MKRILAFVAAAGAVAVSSAVRGADAAAELSLRCTGRPAVDGGRPAFAGKVSTPAQAWESVFATVEAYFIENPGTPRSAPVLSGGAVAGRFEFGRDLPKFREFTIPRDLELETPDGAPAGAGDAKPELCGIVVRVLVGGKPVKAVSNPHNPAWIKAAMSPAVTIGGRSLRLKPPAPGRTEETAQPVSETDIAETVSSAGGCVDAPLRFSIMWNMDGKSKVDLDAHAVEPSGAEIFYGSFKGRSTKNGGMLDVDMIRPEERGVENIFWKPEGALADGRYRFFIRNYDGGKNNGAKAEIVFDGDIFTYEINHAVRGDVDIAVLEVRGGCVVRAHHKTKPVPAPAH